MRGDIPQAAFRLLNALPVRTHNRTQEDYEARLSANNVRPVVIRGVTYESLTEAGRQLGKSRGAVRNMIIAGTARYV